MPGQVSQRLATPQDMRDYGVSGGELESVPDDKLQKYVDGASSLAIGILKKRYAFPLASWGLDLVVYVCQWAAFLYLDAEGYKVLQGQADTIRAKQKMAHDALKNIANGQGDLDNLVDATPDVVEGGSVVDSDPIEGDSLARPGGYAAGGYDLLAGRYVGGR